ncbi:isoprenoid synthase domain-containing protein [Hygrophoropsis aurantiaca]|uniref:Isoprenoid synthase domain-containing protein n=1 Tax=Hygrophoropsis aurantiaca TaxID=72124 RepID=A0ACB8AEM8_9AGAM|nr:isoprenoid synthase domain-containing protein [Hygrophoropsis aurantiaca]
MSASYHPDQIVLPDLISHCNFPLRMNVCGSSVAAASEAWMIRGAKFTEKRRKKFCGLKAGLLTTMCYPDCGKEELRVVTDFMNYLFNLDDWSDGFDTDGTQRLGDCVMNVLYHPETYSTKAIAGKMARSFWLRFIRKAGPRCQRRFLEVFDMFFQAITQQSVDRTCGMIPDLESYISLRRDTSGCKPVFVLMEYAAGIDLPNEVADHPIIQDLNEATNDLVTWSNDIFSYDVEQKRGDTHNMIAVIMQTLGYDLQSAVDFVGRLCKASIFRFQTSREQIPSWGPVIDAQVETYVQGLQDWIVGSLHWSFETERYFGKMGRKIKETREVMIANPM